MLGIGESVHLDDEGLVPLIVSIAPHPEELVIDIRGADLFPSTLYQMISCTPAQDLTSTGRHIIELFEAVFPVVVIH
jgi:hypothetical protein